MYQIMSITSAYTFLMVLITFNTLLRLLFNIMYMQISLQILALVNIVLVFTLLITVLLLQGLCTMPKNTEKLMNLLNELLDIEETGYISGVEPNSTTSFFQIQHLDSEGSKKTTEKFTEEEAIEYLEDHLQNN